MDSGATNHVTTGLENLELNNTYKGKERLMVDNGKCLNITHVGSTILGKHRTKIVKLNNVLRVQDIKRKILFVSLNSILKMMFLLNSILTLV